MTLDLEGEEYGTQKFYLRHGARVRAIVPSITLLDHFDLLIFDLIHVTTS
jgi:hypothetical protein